MESWSVFLKFSNSINEFDEKLELFDIKTYFNGYLKIKRSYFNSLVKTIKMTKKYSTGRAIEKVIGPDDDDWTCNPWMLLIVKNIEKKKVFWFFIKREKNLSGCLVAIGPKPFAEYNSNNNISETKRDIKRIINYIIVYLNKFNCIILLPNFLP